MDFVTAATFEHWLLWAIVGVVILALLMTAYYFIRTKSE
jgi:nicotinamide riboside transporter PnuC